MRSALRVAFILSGGLLCVATADVGKEGDLQRLLFERAEMGVPFRITLYAADPVAGKAAAEAAFARISELNSVLSDYDSDSELSRLSRTSGQGKPVKVSDDLWRVLEPAQRLAVRTGGAFDVTIGPSVSIWRRARRKQELPGPEVIAEMQQRVGFSKLRLDPVARTAELLAPEMRLDLGGIAKGFAVDEALAVLRQLGFPQALVGGAGDIVAGDPPPGEAGWTVEAAALVTPGAPPSQTILLRNAAISTSGDLFQFVEIDGRRYSHIVDPRTGIGLQDQALVTVVAPDCITADALATAISVLGRVEGLKLAEEIPGAAVHLFQRSGERIETAESTRWKDVPKR